MEIHWGYIVENGKMEATRIRALTQDRKAEV